MNITINTDASFCPKDKVGGYAFWITCDNGRIKRSGRLKKPKSSIDSEMKALANAVYVLKKSNLIDGKVNFIYINSDCSHMFSLIGKKSNNQVGRYIAKTLSSILRRGREGIPNRKKRYQLRHVKSHSHTRTKRNWVNDWCDKEARKHMYTQRSFTTQNMREFFNQ